jgi:hypothetical protein
MRGEGLFFVYLLFYKKKSVKQQIFYALRFLIEKIQLN